MDKVKAADFLVKGPVSLEKVPTYNDLGSSEKELKKALKHLRKQLGEFQDVLYAHGKYSVLVCFQGMDTAGKDSLVREVFKDFNVRGVQVHSFKVPTPLELRHDYLWRHYVCLPDRGKFGIFNRTHYENVLVTRVHPEYLLGENIPGLDSLDQVDEAFWEMRFDQINAFEKHLVQNGTIIFKFFLHLSKEEQRNRLLRRLELKKKNWKFSPGDLKERELWDQYRVCYEDALAKTSPDHAPWYIIPADSKPGARYIVASILDEALKKYKDIAPPELDDEIKANLGNYKEYLESEE